MSFTLPRLTLSYLTLPNVDVEIVLKLKVVKSLTYNIILTICNTLQIAAILKSCGGRMTYGDVFESAEFNKIWQKLLPVDNKGIKIVVC